MLSNVTSLTGNGLKDWLIQRVTALYFAIYCLVFFTFLLCHPNISYSDWYSLFHSNWMKVATLMALLALSLHAWIGIWTVTTDYIKCTVIRLLVQMAVVIFLVGQFIWGLLIVWG